MRESRARAELARAFSILGEAELARNEAEAALELAIQADSDQLVTLAAFSLGVVHHHLGEYDRVLELAQQAREAAQRSGDRASVARALNMIGVVHRNRGEFADALTNLLEASNLADPDVDPEGHARALNNLGLVYWNTGNLDAAIQMYEEALAFHREVGNQRAQAFLLNNIGLVFKQRGDLDEALDYFERSKMIKENIGERVTLAATVSNIGLVYQELDRPQQALEYLEHSLRIRTELGDQRGIASSLVSLAATHRDLGNPQRALENARRALEIATRIDAKVEVAEAYGLLAVINEDLGDVDQALEYHKLFHEVDRSLIEPERYKHVIEIQTRYATRSKEREIALLRHEGEIAELKLERERILRYAALIAVALLLVLLISVLSRSRLQMRMNSLRAEANQKLRSSEERYRRLFDDPTTPKAVVVPPTRRISDANAGFAELCGRAREELVGAEIDTIDAPWLESIVTQWTDDDTGSPSERLVTFPGPNGADRDLEVWSSGLVLPEGPARLVSIRDVTERRRLAEETERARKLEAVGVLAGGIAHDFNNAMAAVLGFIGLARIDIGDSGKASKTLRTAETAVLRTRELTSRLIAFSPGGAPQRTLAEIEPHVRDVANGNFGGRVAEVRLDIASDLPPVEIDPLQIQQALRNIILNAVEAGNGGEITVRVAPAGADRSRVRIEIMDRGVRNP